MDQFDGRNGPAASAALRGMGPLSAVSRRSRRALIPSVFFAASLVLTSCSGAETTERGSQAGDSPAAVEESPAQPAPSDGTAADSGVGDAGSSSTPEDGDTHDAGGGTSGGVPADSDDGAADAETGDAGTSEPDAHDEAPADSSEDPLNGAFASRTQACQAISAQMLAIAFAPLSYTYGGGRAAANEAVSQLPELTQKVPSELRDDFSLVGEVFADSGQGYSDFDEAAFEKAVLPIEEWITENCPRV